jgi:hypothetical protein
MEPQTLAARVRWLEHTVEGLSHEVSSIRAQLMALVQLPPTLADADRALAALLQQQLDLMERQCSLVGDRLARLRADLTAAETPDTSRDAGTAQASERQEAGEEPGER